MSQYINIYLKVVINYNMSIIINSKYAKYSEYMNSKCLCTLRILF